MKIEDFFNLYRGFSKEDFLEFKKFLNSPYLVNNKALSRIFEEISNNSNLLIKSDFDKLLKKISKKSKHSSSTIIQRLSSLNKATLIFFKIKSLLSDVENSELSLNDYLLKNKNYSLLKSNLKKTSRIIYDSEKITEKFLLNSFNYNVQICDSFVNNIRFVKHESAGQILSFLCNASIDLSLYSLMQQINLYAFNYFLDVDSGNCEKFYFPIDIYKMLEEFDKNNLFSQPSREKSIYELYKLMFLALYRREDSENFMKYKQCFDKTLNSLNKKLIKFHYNMLINYCAMKERLVEERDFYRKQQVEILLDYTEKGYFKTDDNEHLHSTEYRNFILIAFSIDDFKLLKYFIDNCTSKLNIKDYDDMMNLGLAFYYYGTKNYEKALECINNIEINNFIYRFDIRNILLRVYYETGEFNKLLDSIHNYRRIIFDDRILNKSIKDSLLNLLKYLNKIIIIRNNPNLNLQEEAEFLINLVQNEPTFALKKWILERLGELSKTTKEKEMPLSISI
ncbi:MAG TPA: hypothetical protein VIK14_01450 [Ignavibacteria bacterium]